MENLTAKNIQKFQTGDGYAWSATFYLDGKKIGTASDQGHGGEVDTRDLNVFALGTIEAHAKTLPHFGIENGMDLEQDAAMVLEAVMWDTIDQRKSKRDLKSKVVAKMKDGVFTWKIAKGQTADEVIARVLGKYPDAEILNRMPFAEAHKILTTPTA